MFMKGDPKVKIIMPNPLNPGYWAMLVRDSYQIKLLLLWRFDLEGYEKGKLEENFKKDFKDN